MGMFDKLLDKFKLESTREMERESSQDNFVSYIDNSCKEEFNHPIEKLNTHNSTGVGRKNHAPKYITDMTWSQDRDQSICTSDGRYDLKKFSNHESATVNHILKVVKNKYPKQYQSMGLVNEAYMIKYKPRYVLFEIAIILYEKSENPIDKLAVSLAYESKGAYFRKNAIDYFESAEPYITPEFMQDFISYMPLKVYTTFADLYEGEHEYEKAIKYINIAKKYGDADNPHFDMHINKILEKQSKGLQKSIMKMSKKQQEFENDVTEAAKRFLGISSKIENVNPIKPEKVEEPVQYHKKYQKDYNKDILLYAARCEKHAQEQDYMEKLGILDEYNQSE